MSKTSMTMYDFAKQLVANENPMDPILFNKKVYNIADNMSGKFAWMLLCRERNDYTIFLTKEATKKRIAKDLIPTLHNRGKVLLMDEQPNGAYEIWIRDSIENKDVVYYLFDYSNGIINCNE